MSAQSILSRFVSSTSKDKTASRAQAQAEAKLSPNPLCMAGAAFGVISCSYTALGILPVMGMVFSLVGVITFDREKDTMQWLGYFGLALNVIITTLQFQTV